MFVRVVSMESKTCNCYMMGLLLDNFSVFSVLKEVLVCNKNSKNLRIMKT